MNVNATVADVMKQVRQHIILHVAVKANQDAAACVLQDHPLVERGRSRRQNAQSDPQARSATTTATCRRCWSKRGHKLTLFREEELSLESAFMALTKGMGQKT